MGAPVGNTLLNYFKINTKLIPMLLEKNNLRDGLIVQSHIPIKWRTTSQNCQIFTMF